MGEKTQTMSQIEHTLAQYPSLGLLGTVLGFGTSLIPSINPYLQFAVLVLSAVVAVLTIEARWKERKKK